MTTFYLCVLRQLGVIVALVFVLGLISGVIAGISLVDDNRTIGRGQAWLGVCLVFLTPIVYTLFDRLMRNTLGSRYYRPRDCSGHSKHPQPSSQTQRWRRLGKRWVEEELASRPYEH